MTRKMRALAMAGGLIAGMAWGDAAQAQKIGGILHVYFFDSPASMSIHEESTIAGQGPMMGVFNNLVMYKQDVPQSGLNTIVPDLATEWSWDEGKTELSFKLRQGVTWHDGKPFTARDVKCTWDLLTGKSSDRLRLNPRKSWYRNLDEVAVKGDYEAVFRLKRPQPAFIALLASGFSPVYPCHVPPGQMRQHPIGTGPFKFVEFKPNESIKVTRNPDYWKKGRPYLDGIEYTIIKNQSTGALAFVSGKVDMTSPFFLQVPVLKDIKEQRPEATCALVPSNVQRNVIINREAPPFDNPLLRRAVALTLDRRAFIDTLTQGKGDIGGAMLAPPEGIWSMPPELMMTMPGYDPDVAKNRAGARKLMEAYGYSDDKRLSIKVSTRNIPPYRDPAVILIDQLKQIYIDGELDPIDTTGWYPKVMRKDYTIGLNLTGNSVDDPDPTFYENYACGAEGNYDGYCNPEVDKMIDRQSVQFDQDRRKKLVWEIELKLAEDVARPVLYHNRSGTCWAPYVKGYVPMVNSIYNGLRMEDVWLDK
ncbi:MAG: ABC transporter substrate-binding protein [Alphaproteobacteria bacterium]|nr:ABC transporter substrate-binding protein [Alphaproteobacteria bacterium]